MKTISLFPRWLDRGVCGWMGDEQMNRWAGRRTDGWMMDG